MRNTIITLGFIATGIFVEAHIAFDMGFNKSLQNK